VQRAVGVAVLAAVLHGSVGLARRRWAELGLGDSAGLYNSVSVMFT
jgi:hypothetical protein